MSQATTVRQVTKLSEEELEHASDVFSRAFAPDALIGKFVLQSDPGVTRRWFKVRLKQCIAAGALYMVGDGLGYSMWYPPHTFPIPPSSQIYQESGFTALERDLAGSTVWKNWTTFRDVMGEFDKAVGQITSQWRLQLLAVDPNHQRKGLGTVLLQHTLEKIDLKGASSNLDTESEHDVRLYNRLGFQVTGASTIEIPGLPSLNVRRMVRSPRTAQGNLPI